jgi:predicted small secreted protein
MKKSILLTFVLAAGFVATLLTGCGEDNTSSTIKTDNYVGTYYGYFTLESLAFSNAALDTVIGKELLRYINYYRKWQCYRQYCYRYK